MTVQRVSSLRAGIAYEDDVWQRGEPGLIAWSSAPGIAVPASHASATNFGAAARMSATHGRPVERRHSGGGAVPQGPGVLNLGWLFPLERSRGIRNDYDVFADALIRALATTGIDAAIHSPLGAWCAGAHDVSVGGRKIAGISQRRAPGGSCPRGFVHAALFVDLSLRVEFNLLQRYLEAAGLGNWPHAGAATTLAMECGGGVFDRDSAALKIVRVMQHELATQTAEDAHACV